MARQLDVDVLVPTWRRPSDLRRLLVALGTQTHLPKNVFVTVREDDASTWDELERSSNLWSHLHLVAVSVPPGPLTKAMSIGLSRTRGNYVALTDDDSEPSPIWIQQLLGYFANPEIGGVGGRDDQAHEPGEVFGEREVGCINLLGRLTANHHLGAGPAREVDVLKGVNCCFRGDLLREIGFDFRLRGKSNVSHWEMSLCFAMRRRGWKLVYDPSIRITHHVAPREDGDVNARGDFEAESYLDSVHNETLATLEFLPTSQRFVYRIWSSLIGTRASPGILQFFRLSLQHGNWKLQLSRFLTARRGRRQGLKTFRASGES
ncbi:MAG: glycosyltransferase [Aureliella sp.]